MSAGRPRTRKFFCKLALGLTALYSLTQAQDAYDIIYNDVGSLPCVRLLNATGFIGCQSINAATGVLFRTDSQDEIQQFASNKDLGNKYTVIMPHWLLTSPNIQLLKSSDKLGAIIAVINGTDPVYSPAVRPANAPSPDSTCPNCEFGLYAGAATQYQWNPTGTGLLYEQFDFPIYALNTMDARNTMSYNAVMQAAGINKFRGYTSYPLKALQFNAFMWAAQDTGACLRKKWCTPVGGASVWATPSTNISFTDNKPIVMVSAAIDSRSLFHDLTIGVESSLTGMVTVLAVAEALSRSTIPLDTMPKHILYTLFTGEAWGFSGSQRFVQDITSRVQCIKPAASGPGCAFPFYPDFAFQSINPDKIEAILEAGQVGSIGSAPGGSGLFAHVDNIQSGLSAALVKQVVQMGSGTGNNTAAAPGGTVPVQSADSDGVQRGLPPSSAMSFLKARANIPTVVLTGYQEQMSPLTSQDTDDSWDPVTTGNSIAQAASVISKTAWLQAQGLNDAALMTEAQQQAIGSISVDPQLIQDLLYCLARNYSCPLVDRYLNVTANPNAPTRLPHYTGTLYSQSQPYPIFVWNFLANMTRHKAFNSTAPPVVGCSSKPGLVNCASNEYCVGDQCVLSLTRYHDSYGTGLAMGEEGGYYIKDASKPVWVESTWNDIGLRLFDVTSPGAQKAELATGIVLTLVSAGVVWYARKYVAKTLKVD
ncbi:hypothetical protein BGZ67_005770 [Mortierella alpina]|nr:hypothetical protein BGZ67_005770 [Mortierella alpina]